MQTTMRRLFTAATHIGLPLSRSQDHLATAISLLEFKGNGLPHRSSHYSCISGDIPASLAKAWIPATCWWNLSKCNRVPCYLGLSLTLILHSDKTLMFSCNGGYRYGWQSSGSVVQRTSAFFMQPKMGLGTRLENITLIKLHICFYAQTLW